MTIRYIYHSGFIVEEGICAFIIDCCGLTKNSAALRGLAGKNLYIMASHVHGDHFDPAIMNFEGTRRKWILSADIRKKIHPDNDICFLEKGGCFADEFVKIKAFGSTDEGISFFIETGGKKIFHAGDLNNWHWNEEETPEDAAKNERWFLDELAHIAREIPELDVLMFPVDPRLGKDYTKGAWQFLDSVKTGLFIPMHFWDNIAAASAFRPAAEQRGCRFADIRANGDVFEV